MRLYDTTAPELLFDECKIWEACRATSAATSFFDPIKIGKFGQEFADGAVLYNNPIRLVEQEASLIWPGCIESALMVSIGTGCAPGGRFGGNLSSIITAMKAIITETETTHNDFFQAHRAMVDQNRLYRFNVFHGLSDVGLEEAKEKAEIVIRTRTYLNKAETCRLAESCIRQLCNQEPPGAGSSLLSELEVNIA